MILRKTPKHAGQFIALLSVQEWKRIGRWFAWCVLLAAALNGAFAASRLETLRHNTKIPTILRNDEDMPKRWPTPTPHDKPWPTPNDWSEFLAFGNRRYDVSLIDSDRHGLFYMRAQVTGWPLPVLLQQSLSWDQTNAAFPGPNDRKPVRLMPLGLILNPIIIGGSAYLLLISPLLAFVIGRRFERRRQGLCTRCGCDMRGIENNICPKRDAPQRAETSDSAERRGDKARLGPSDRSPHHHARVDTRCKTCSRSASQHTGGTDGVSNRPVY